MSEDTAVLIDGTPNRCRFRDRWRTQRGELQKAVHSMSLHLPEYGRESSCISLYLSPCVVKNSSYCALALLMCRSLSKSIRGSSLCQQSVCLLVIVLSILLGSAPCITHVATCLPANGLFHSSMTLPAPLRCTWSRNQQHSAYIIGLQLDRGKHGDSIP